MCVWATGFLWWLIALYYTDEYMRAKEPSTKVYSSENSFILRKLKSKHTTSDSWYI